MAAPLQGVFLGHHLDASFKQVGFLRDCFPSGHTAQTLVAAYFGIRYAAKGAGRFALAFVAASIVFATLYCRMHYAIDVLAGAPLAILSISACEWLSRRALRVYVALPSKARVRS
jgi:membrane-associated phospholipid phosphatase